MQQPTKVPASEAARHLLKGSAPEYPQIARIAHIQGKVILQLNITPDGEVTNLRAVSGHPVLIQPAMDAVRKWKYDPFFLNGTAAPVETTVYLLFAQGTEAPLQVKYFAQEIECRDLLNLQRFDEAGKSCRSALEMAQTFKSDTLGLKVNAYGNAGLAASHLKLFPEALEDFQERLKVAKKQLPKEDATWFDVHHDLAVTLLAIGQTVEAENEYRETERALKAESKALEQSLNMKEYVTRQQDQINARMRKTLSEHAALLQKMGRGSEAAELEEQAKSLPGSK